MMAASDAGRSPDGVGAALARPRPLRWRRRMTEVFRLAARACSAVKPTSVERPAAGDLAAARAASTVNRRPPLRWRGADGAAASPRWTPGAAAIAGSRGAREMRVRRCRAQRRASTSPIYRRIARPSRRTSSAGSSRSEACRGGGCDTDILPSKPIASRNRAGGAPNRGERAPRTNIPSHPCMRRRARKPIGAAPDRRSARG